ncbi:hypothetical protein GOC09_15355, partial [Sinorhizobium meliloti]|nr:hypothetical protein [Sinorhizobium meliloti]MDX0039104.1 hypothetical protein [Sinorhizobium meliloti]MDX0088601.1 hypothetical protein [Sinorhizobium meliloti]
RGRLFLGIGGRDHFGIRGRIASEFAHLRNKSTENPNNRPIFTKVSSVGFAFPARSQQLGAW